MTDEVKESLEKWLDEHAKADPSVVSKLDEWIEQWANNQGREEKLAHAYGKWVRKHTDNDGNQAIKADSGKPLAGCLLEFPVALGAFAEVCTYGAKKYGRHSWREVESHRYVDALMRHVIAMGEDCDEYDDESGIPHVAHVMWNSAAILELLTEGI